VQSSALSGKDEETLATAIVTRFGGLIGSDSVQYLGFDVVGLENDMRSSFFGPGASTRPVSERLVERYPDEFRREMGSRYLFIVLYTLLERYLSRGDYVRPSEPLEAEGDDAREAAQAEPSVSVGPRGRRSE
jgi:hypothetical protein